ncbi:WD40-repeat-containing domain protein [Zopfochytrium polystomum]|nr:WD40-repeat-containing domain protein [Zopfochytrium polystomum]
MSSRTGPATQLLQPAGQIGPGRTSVDASATQPPIHDDALESPNTYYLEVAAVKPDLEDSDEELDYQEVLVEEFEDLSDSDGEETLEKAVRNINEKTFFGGGGIAGDEVGGENAKGDEPPTASLTKRQEVVDDFIRNYLSSKGLFKSLEAFQNEWFEFQQKNRLTPEDVNVVPDIYQKNQELADSLLKLRIDVENYKEIASKARATYDKLRKERDFHRMHHKRVVQEKNRLIGDIKRLKKHYESYEPTLKQLRHRYEIAMKEKMLTKLERDRLAGKVQGLEASLKSGRGASGGGVGTGLLPGGGAAGPGGAGGVAAAAESGYTPPRRAGGGKAGAPGKESVLPVEDRRNVYLHMDMPTAKVEKFKQIHSVRAHGLAVSSVKFHPKKMILATVSDDKLWKMWAFPSCELLMSGEGHKDWIADCDFHPKGTHLATASGDHTVKLWDFARGVATLTLGDHTQAVWSCAFHDTGDFLASCSMDQTAKLWDVNTGKCRQTFRGHADSVNHVGFVPFTNTLYTCSGDKTISLWDVRTGLCSQTMYGHVNSINHATFSLRGDTFASCDSSGVVKFWDIRNVSELSSIDFGPRAANKLAFDPSGIVLAVAGEDGVKTYNVRERARGREFSAGSDAVQAALFDRNGECLVTAGSDSFLRVFQ